MTDTKTQPAGTATDPHRAHLAWRAEHANWLDDVELWLDEYRRAIGDLDGVEARLKEFMVAVERHAATVQLHDDGICKHEHELVGLHCLGIDRHDLDGPAHARWGAKHAAEREEHERLKAKVHELIALVRKLEAGSLAGPRGA